MLTRLAGLTRRYFCTNAPAKKVIDVNTNVRQDVVLYHYDNARFFTILNVASAVQYIIWSLTSYSIFISLKDAPVDESKITKDSPWYRKINLGEKKYKYFLTFFPVLIGTAALLSVWTLTSRSVKQLILHKGGQKVTFITYLPYGGLKAIKVDLNRVSCLTSRYGTKYALPIKIKGQFLYYLVDNSSEGLFKNPTLFDHTAGLSRKLK